MSYSFEYTPLKSKDVMVRKAHRCEWCGEAINVGEPAHYRAYKLEGDFNHGWMHLECNSAMLTAPADLVTEGWFPGEFKRGTVEER